MKDVFICHAGEDKDPVARPLVKALEQRNISCWLDEAEVQWGDSITEKIHEGLRTSRYVIVILSSAFLEKNWPQREFSAALSQESSSGEVKVLPLFFGDADTRETVREMYPLIHDKIYLVWDGDAAPIVEALQRRLDAGNNPPSFSDSKTEEDSMVFIPPIKKPITQRDRDRFLIEAFDIIKHYFQAGLDQLENAYKQIETDFREIHNQKFICKVYANGTAKGQCKVWVGGFTRSDSIAYAEGQFNVDADNTYNEMVSVDVSNDTLSLQLTMGGAIGTATSNKTRGLSPEQAAESLWKRFLRPLHY